MLLFIAQLCLCVVGVFSCVFFCARPAASGAESLMKFNSLTWSFCHDCRERARREGGGGANAR